MSPLARRDFLQVAATAACAACLPLAGCGSGDKPAAGPLLIDLSELPEGVKVRREWAGQPLELLRRGDEVRARSLLCTHQGCEVIWSDSDAVYVCPCHDGQFDAEGRPLYGPPRKPLRDFTVTRRNGVVSVDI